MEAPSSVRSLHPAPQGQKKKKKNVSSPSRRDEREGRAGGLGVRARWKENKKREGRPSVPHLFLLLVTEEEDEGEKESKGL